jgi:hypothetical protein
MEGIFKPWILGELIKADCARFLNKPAIFTNKPTLPLTERAESLVKIDSIGKKRPSKHNIKALRL